MSKLSYELKDVDFSRMVIKESKNNPNIFSINYKQDDSTVKSLLIKTPFIDCNFSGLFFDKDKDGNVIEDKDRMQWRAFLTDEKMIAKLNELQEEIEKNKLIFTGPISKDKKGQKDFNMQNIIGENTDKNGVTHQYGRFNIRHVKNTDKIETAFFDMKGQNLNIQKLKDFESQFRPREFRYRLVFSMYGWKMKSTYLYGVSFSIEQMQIEITSSGTNIKEILKSVNLFDDANASAAKVDLSSFIENADADVDDDADEDEDDENIVASVEKMELKSSNNDEDEDDDEEIVPTKKAASVSVKTKTVSRKKGSSSNA